MLQDSRLIIDCAFVPATEPIHEAFACRGDEVDPTLCNAPAVSQMMTVRYLTVQPS
jgi:hypothetical protein